MYPANFRYHAPSSVSEALLLASQHEDARFLAGGHSLIPLMKQRLVQPSDVIDLAGVRELSGINDDGQELSIGSLTTHREIHSSALVALRCPLLAEAAGLIGDAQVRNCGTIGGSLSFADPGADYPACAVALDVSLVCANSKGGRTVAAVDWFQGLLATALAPAELLVEIRVPTMPPGTGTAYLKRAHPASRLAMVGVAAVVTIGADGLCTSARLGITGLGPKAFRATALERKLIGRALLASELSCAEWRLPKEIEIAGDHFASAEDKRLICEAMIRRAVAVATERAANGQQADVQAY